jgi:hypothetical protein
MRMAVKEGWLNLCEQDSIWQNNDFSTAAAVCFSPSLKQ